MTRSLHRLLNAREKTRLRIVTEAIEGEAGVEIAVLVVPGADDVPALARAYFDRVGIGKRGHDNGVLILVAMDNRAIHIELGRGLGTVVRPEDAKRVIDFVVAPLFRHGRFGEGLIRGVEAIGHLVARGGASGTGGQ